MVCIKFYSGPLLTGFLKLSWPSLDPTWNKVTGLSTPAVCPKVWEPWEKSEAWPYKHDPATSTTEQQKQLRAARDGKSLLLQGRISRPRTQSHTNKGNVFQSGVSSTFRIRSWWGVVCKVRRCCTESAFTRVKVLLLASNKKIPWHMSITGAQLMCIKYLIFNIYPKINHVSFYGVI